MIVYSICGSFCTHKKSLAVLEKFVSKGYDILPVMSEKTYSTDTRFGKSEKFIEAVEKITGRKIISTIKNAEPIGPEFKPEAMIICPCTGNTLAKLANGITDSSVTMAAKAHLRNGKPLLIALASNDALSANLENIGKLMRAKNIYFVPMYQDDKVNKPTSLVADFDSVEKSFEAMCDNAQIQPVFLGEK